MQTTVKITKKACDHALIQAPVSKSAAHRLLICAALADKPTAIRCDGTNADIEATVGCLRSLGATVTKNGDTFLVTPISKEDGCYLPAKGNVLDCGESGSTERFLLPVACALGADATIVGSGRLPSRPLSPLYEVMSEHGAKMSENGKLPLFVGGRLTVGDYEIDGGVSSQFISGLLFALSLLGGGSSVTVTGKCESAHYIDMTLDALGKFGVHVVKNGNVYTIPEGSRYIAPKETFVEGDWSNAAFWLCAGAVGNGSVTVCGLSDKSLQGDKAVFNILQRFGAKCTQKGTDFTVEHSKLKATQIDAADIPDLVPVLSVVAACAEGRTVINNIARLRIKESDRVATVLELLDTMGIRAYADDDTMYIYGGKLAGGTVSSHNDHRIAMSAAVAAVAADGDVTVLGAWAVNKSYPDFYEKLAPLADCEFV